MKKMMWVTVFLMTTMSAGVCSATEISDTSLHQLLVLSGIDKMTTQLSPMVREGMEQARRKEEKDNKKPAMSDHDYKVMENDMVSSFKPDDLLKIVSTQVRHHISEQDARKMLVWYNSRIGKRINTAEEDAGTVRAYRQMRAEARQLLANKPLVQYARELDQVDHATGIMMKTQENIALALYIAFSTSQHPDRPLHIKVIRQKIEAAMHKERPRYEQMTIIYSVYAYRNIDMASLQKYLAFMKTPTAMRFSEYANGALSEGISQAMAKMAKIAAADAKKKPHQSIKGDGGMV